MPLPQCAQGLVLVQLVRDDGNVELGCENREAPKENETFITDPTQVTPPTCAPGEVLVLETEDNGNIKLECEDEGDVEVADEVEGVEDDSSGLGNGNTNTPGAP